MSSLVKKTVGFRPELYDWLTSTYPKAAWTVINNLVEALKIAQEELPQIDHIRIAAAKVKTEIDKVQNDEDADDGSGGDEMESDSEASEV